MTQNKHEYPCWSRLHGLYSYLRIRLSPKSALVKHDMLPARCNYCWLDIYEAENVLAGAELSNTWQRGEGVWRWGEREIIYLSLHCHHQNDFCIKMGSDESHFNVSVGSDGQSHKTLSTNHNLFEEKGEPKRYRTEVLPLTSLTPYR